MIKVYINFGSLKAFKEGNWVNAKIQFANQYDVEVLLDLNKIDISLQNSGLTIRKKKWFRK